MINKFNTHFNINSLNVQGIISSNNFDRKIQTLLSKHSSNNSILCLQEAKITQIKRVQFELNNNFTIIGDNNNKTKILMNKDYLILEDPIVLNTTLFQDRVTSALIKLPFTIKKTVLINCYFPTSSASERAAMLAALHSSIELYCSNDTTTEIILVGDFNHITNIDDTSNPASFKESSPDVHQSNLLIS